MSSEHKKAVAAIERRGALLVYPLKDRPDIPSLWSELYPRAKMVWSWDADADGRVSKLWLLREELSRSGEVVYLKWFQGRATFFSKTLFTALLRANETATIEPISLPEDSGRILEILLSDSPLSTKLIKEQAEMQGKFFESAYSRAMKPLWNRFLVVGFGEVEDSSFPSLAVGATQNLFEDLWMQAGSLKPAAAQKIIDEALPEGSAFRKFYLRSR